MKSNSKKKVIVAQKIYPNQINELALCCFIIKKDKLDKLHQFIADNGGRVVAAVPSQGISRLYLFEALTDESFETYFVICTCQKEIVDIFMLDACREFNFHKKGKGKAFVLDVLGYMGAKGLFVE